ncbi:hypothetical protein [Promicromonospora sukumoe]|uniref:hypothetical protein n=1 Tax=Promicromonospora sukumoe TaxID=88382 RepID=UPI0003A8737D|nr:hypothetical protein [Promicromonospora sukumoe]
MRPQPRAQNDPLARARRALDQVDGELDLTRLHAATSGHGRPDPDLLPLDDDAQVEILRSGQHPTQPRRRAAVWALTATVALLCGAGVGTALLWSDAGETQPGSQVPASPRPEVTAPPPSPSPEPTPSTDPRECSPARPTPSATPREPRPTTNERASEACDAAEPSRGAGQAVPSDRVEDGE